MLVETLYGIMTPKKKVWRKEGEEKSKKASATFQLKTVILWDKEVIYSEVYEHPQSQV